jgi:hypothetical protein
MLLANKEVTATLTFTDNNRIAPERRELDAEGSMIHIPLAISDVLELVDTLMQLQST